MLLLGLGVYVAQLYFWLGLESPCLSGLLLLACLRIHAWYTEGKINSKM